MRVLNADELYDILTTAMVAARQVEDNEAADEIEAAIETLNAFAMGHIATALAAAL